MSDTGDRGQEEETVQPPTEHWASPEAARAPSQQIDAICDAFEAEWRAGRRPSWREFLERGAAEDRARLLRELLAVELQLRAAAGERAVAKDYGDLEARIVVAALLRDDAHSSSANSRHAGMLRALLACPTFARLPGRAVGDLASRMRWQEHEPGALLVRQGAEAAGLHIVLKGMCRVSVEAHGTRDVLDEVGPGAVIGEMAMLTGKPATADVVALTPVTTICLEVDAFDQLRLDHPELEIVLSQLVGDRLGGREFDSLCGKRIGGRLLRRCLGRGAMGVVYEAERADGARVALKMLRHGLVHDQGAVARFRNEAELLGRLRHPGIVAVSDLFVEFNTLFLEMEYCDGIDLAACLRDAGAQGRHVPTAWARPALGQLAAALGHAHEANVVHLDLKPSNILVTRDGQLKLADFGLARLCSEESTLGAVVGTPQYMAPEQLSALAASPESDWYAWGCVAYELLVGRPLFADLDLLELAVEKGRWTPPTPWPEIADPEIAEWLRGSLSPLPEERRLDLEAIARHAAPLPPGALLPH